MKLTKISAVCLIVLCGCLLHGGTPESLPKLEIISAIYGKAPETADITETIRKSVRYGMYLDFHNHPRWTGKNFKIPNADKKIHLVYKLGGEQKELECRYNARIRLGELLPKFQFGTPEWLEYFIDFSGTAMAVMEKETLITRTVMSAFTYRLFIISSPILTILVV